MMNGTLINIIAPPTRTDKFSVFILFLVLTRMTFFLLELASTVGQQKADTPLMHHICLLHVTARDGREVGLLGSRARTKGWLDLIRR